MTLYYSQLRSINSEAHRYCSMLLTEPGAVVLAAVQTKSKFIYLETDCSLQRKSVSFRGPWPWASIQCRSGFAIINHAHS